MTCAHWKRSGARRFCSILTCACPGKSCTFFQTEAECRAGLARAYARLASLPREQQRSIADTYYDGQMPWLRRNWEEFSLKGANPDDLS